MPRGEYQEFSDVAKLKAVRMGAQGSVLGYILEEDLMKLGLEENGKGKEWIKYIV